jgi:hypothetical protein
MKETINQDILPLFQMRSGRKSWGKKEKERKMDIQTCRKKDDKKTLLKNYVILLQHRIVTFFLEISF